MRRLSRSAAVAAIATAVVMLSTTWPVAAQERTTTPAAEAHSAAASGDFATLLFVLMLSTLIGLGVITRVSRLLHTPLMSLTNAISAIAIVGAILVAGPDYPLGYTIVGAIAVAASMTNIVSGFLITDRMLKMFKRQEPHQP